MAGNRWSDKEWRSALRTALLEKDEKHGTKLRAIADVVVRSALDGKMDAITEIGNRLDGRPAQDLTIQKTVTHDLSSYSDAQLSELIARGVGRNRGSGEGDEAPPSDTGKLH